MLFCQVGFKFGEELCPVFVRVAPLQVRCAQIEHLVPLRMRADVVRAIRRCEESFELMALQVSWFVHIGGLGRGGGLVLILNISLKRERDISLLKYAPPHPLNYQNLSGSTSKPLKLFILCLNLM